MHINFKSVFIFSAVFLFGAGAVFFAKEWAGSRLEPTELEETEEVEEIEEVVKVELPKSKGEIATVVVSSNMESRGDCHDHYTDGCDIFSAKVDLSTGEVTNVKQLTDNDFADINPVLSLDGKMVYFTQSTGSGDSVMGISVDGGEAELLVKEANNPFPSPDGKTLYFTLKKKSLLATLDLTDATAKVQELEKLISTHESQVSRSGIVGFYKTGGSGRGSKTAQAMMYIPSTGEIVEVSPADGTAHCFWNYDGSALYCNNAGGGSGGILSFSISEDFSVGESSVAIKFPKFTDLESVDPQFDKDCINTAVFYGSFCDENQVMLTAGCYTKNMVDGEREQEFTQTMILDIDSGEYLPLGKNIVEAYGVPGGTTWEGSCVL